jgi:hypothetical protein
VSYYLAPSLVGLRNEVNARHPNRDRSSDGWIGDPSHAARVSDHNPDGRGMVHAIDVDSSGINVPAFLRAVIGDPRTWYVIHNRTIWSRTYGFRPRAYTGSNPHLTHVHVSIRYSSDAERAGGVSWYGNTRRTRGLPTVDVSRVVDQLEEKPRKLEERPGVRIVQRALNDRFDLERGNRLTVDGLAGPRTRAALRRIPGKTDAVRVRKLARGRYKVRK